MAHLGGLKIKRRLASKHVTPLPKSIYAIQELRRSFCGAAVAVIGSLGENAPHGHQD